MAATPTLPQRRPRLAWIAGLALAGSLAGCGGTANPPASTGGGPTPASASADDVVEVDGSSTVYQISREAMQGYKKVAPKVNVIVNKSGTGGGFGKYLDNKLELVGASRPAKDSEESKAKAQGIDWERFLVGYDGITVVVNPKNDFVKELSVEQLKTLWAPKSAVKTWKNLDASWPDRKISFFSPDEDSGTFDFFTEAVVGKAKSQRDDVQPSSDDNTLVKGVAGEDDGIGYFGYAYFKANSSSLRAIPIKKSAEAPAVMPSPATILDKSYSPLARPLFLYVKKAAMRRPTVAGFVTYYVENARTLAVKAKYVSPTDEDATANRAILAKLAPGVAPTPAASSSPAP